jgi:hypothetical protein
MHISYSAIKNYIEGMDYFATEESLLEFVHTQVFDSMYEMNDSNDDNDPIRFYDDHYHSFDYLLFDDLNLEILIYILLH